MTSAEVRAEGASGVHLLMSRSRVPLPSMDGGKRESRKGRRQSEPDRREPSPQAPNPLTE
jgi:hypothetical protein